MVIDEEVITKNWYYEKFLFMGSMFSSFIYCGLYGKDGCIPNHYIKG